MAHISPRVRARISEGARSSMAVLADLIEEHFSPRSVLDVGCGEGFLTSELRSRGIESFGVDGDELPGVDRLIDLRDPPELGQWDVAVSLEVGEHLPEEAAERFVRLLCRSAPVVVFSAAIVAQGGPGHVNEQWPGYWVERFAAAGHVHASGALRWQVWDDERIEPWYRQNLLVFSSEPFDLVEDGCPAVVHPGIWSVYR